MQGLQKMKMQQLQIRAGFEASTYNEKENTVELIWSAGARGLREPWWGEAYYEELSMEEQHIRMGRLNNKAPLLAAHNAYDLEGVIGVIERAWIQDGKGHALVRFSKREAVAPIIQDVRDGVLANVSVGYRVYKYEQVEGGADTTPVYRATDWEPMEVSLVPIGFDDSAKVRAQKSEMHECEVVLIREQKQLKSEERTMPPVEQDKEVKSATQADLEKEKREAAKEATRAERARCAEIKKLCRSVGLDEKFEAELTESEKTIDECRAAIIDKVAETRNGKEISNKHVTVQHGEQDETKTRNEGMELALLHRADPMGFKLEEKAKPYRGMSLLRMAEEILGSRVSRGMSRSEIAARALSTSDFPIVLANVASKSLRAAYELQPRTFQAWVRFGTLPDYKSMDRIQLGSVGDLEKVLEGGEYKYGKFGEGKEAIQVSDYGKILKITERVIVNDDLDAMARIPAMLGAAAARLESKLVYTDVIMGNPTMGDSVALFHTASHGNLASAGTTIPNGLSAARAAMRKQKDLDSNDYLDIAPAFLIVGPDKETEALQTLSGELLATKSTDVNVFKNSMKPVVEARITGNNWFLAADKSQIDTVEVAYLDGMVGPQVSSKQGFESDCVMIKIKHVVGVKAIDYRGLYKNPGA